ncbi:GIY-YIG nuclease family protein [Candidatus Uhrbacteria bacterium]|nr:GIY-YIG nuclease family protein [Candidatus Uhrbacteria bacterium]
MYYVYVLRNNTGRLYIGFTNDLKERVRRHQSGEVYTTKRLGGFWELIYYEASRNEIDAKKRERTLKTGYGWAYIKKRLRFDLKEYIGLAK